MRIGVFSDTYTPQVNGVVTSINTIKAELQRQGHEVFIFAPRVKKTERLDNVFYFSSAAWPTSPEHHLSFPYALHLSKFSDLKLDIIHSQTPFSLGILAVFLAKKYKIPIVHTYHTLFTEYVHYVPILGHSFVDHFAKSQSRRYCQSCQRIIVPSTSMKKELIEWGVKRPIDVIPTGIDVEPAKKADGQLIRKRYSLENKKIVLYAGRLAKEKNITFLLKVIQQISAVRKNILFVILGDGPFRSNLEDYVKKNHLENFVLFTGYVKDRTHLYNWMNTADIFMFSSLTETQGLVVLEAMATGTPVVAVSSMGVKDVIGDNVGGLASELDITEFALKVNYLLTDEQFRQEKSEEALKKVNDFTIEKMTGKIIDLYQDLIQDRC